MFSLLILPIYVFENKMVDEIKSGNWCFCQILYRLHDVFNFLRNWMILSKMNIYNQKLLNDQHIA